MKLTEITTSIKDSHFRELVSVEGSSVSEITLYKYDVNPRHLPDDLQVEDDDSFNKDEHEYSVIGFVWVEDDGREICRRQYLLAQSVTNLETSQLFELDDVEPEFYVKAEDAIREMSSSRYSVDEDSRRTFIYDSLTPHHLYHVAEDQVDIDTGVISISPRNHSYNEGIVNLINSYLENPADTTMGIAKTPFFCRFGFMFPHAK